MVPITITELLHILKLEGKLYFAAPKNPFFKGEIFMCDIDFDKSYTCSFLQAEEDCTRAITLDKKVTFFERRS